MALTDENGGMVMPVSPMYGGNGGFGDFGGNGWWILILFILLGGWNNGGFGGGFGNNGGELYPWMNQSNQMSNGFRDQMMNTTLNGIQNAVTTGFGDVQNALCAGFNQAEIAANGRQMADMQQNFAAQTATIQGFNAVQAQLAQCCCDQRAGLADLRYTVASEACADRAAVDNALRDLLTAQNAGTQRILDQMCQDKLDAKNDLIAQLRSELMYARGQASQDVQTSAIQAGQRALANEIEQYVLPTPRPAYIVQNPNCCAPNYGCGCGTV